MPRILQEGETSEGTAPAVRRCGVRGGMIGRAARAALAVVLAASLVPLPAGGAAYAAPEAFDDVSDVPAEPQQGPQGVADGGEAGAGASENPSALESSEGGAFRAGLLPRTSR